ncbi:MAG: CPBP family intramembrane metalloprotease [Bacteroidota bacterium]|nr:CPBP family intramembrane metalloprotease [Bacteroidota bacterium]MDX5430792.1 CPBP family intramembrane metalloprotease [Bacteroidota bacterium]MDX5469537.1 CPBP family intramembrane metalloprotease [Bacteroidota bacterium]
MLQRYDMTENQDMDHYEEIEKPKIWYILQFISLLLMAVIGAGMFGALAVSTCEVLFGVDGVSLLANPDFEIRSNLYGYRYIQVLSSIGTFVFASIAQLVFMREPLGEGLGLQIRIKPGMALLSVLLVFTLQPVISFLAEWSLGWSFPAGMEEMEAQLREYHNKAVELQFSFVKNQSFLDLLFNLFMMAALPAFAEELFFRRVGMRILYDITRNAHVSIVISALLFAVVHGQFFYLIPLFLFGLVLGYLALWSRSLWLPVLAHFTNNALTLMLSYFYPNLGAEQEMDFGMPLLSFVVASLISVGILLLLKKQQASD